MPDKQVYTKYAMRLLEDLKQLHSNIEQIFSRISSGIDFFPLLENQQRLSHRIGIQKNFLNLIIQQHPLQTPQEENLNQEISCLGQTICVMIDEIQPLLSQKRQELAHLLATNQFYFHGHKKALCQNHSAPRLLDISL